MSIVTDEQIIKVLHQYNPWWRTSCIAKLEIKPHKRLPYYQAYKILTHKTIRRFAILSGLRRVGKTTIIYQLIAELLNMGISAKNILYVSFDNPILKFVNVDDVLSIYEYLYPKQDIQYVFFDEIQYTDNWELWMKVIYDKNPNIRLVATGSASPILEKKSTDSGTGRWTILRIPTMSFYEYCNLLELQLPNIPNDLKITDLCNLETSVVYDLVNQFKPLQNHFNRYLTIGGFPELALSDDDFYAQRMLREDVVDKVLKRDIMTLFNIRNPALMEKLFLYLCLNDTEIFNAQTVSKELDNISIVTINNYIEALKMANLIYISNPVNVGSKGALKGKPKIYISDAAICNAVLMIDEILSDETLLGSIVETAVYTHILSFYSNSLAKVGYFRKAKDNQKEVDVVVERPRSKILFEVKYKNNSHIPKTDAIVELCKDNSNNISNAFLVTKHLDDFGVAKHNTNVPIFRVPAIVLLYILGKNEPYHL